MSNAYNDKFPINPMQCIIFIGFSRIKVDVNECFVTKEDSAMVETFSNVASAVEYKKNSNVQGLIIPSKHYDAYIIIAKGYLEKKDNVNANYVHSIISQSRRRVVHPNELF